MNARQQARYGLVQVGLTPIARFVRCPHCGWTDTRPRYGPRGNARGATAALRAALIRHLDTAHTEKGKS